MSKTNAHPSAHESDGNHGLSLQPNKAKALVCVLGVLVFVFDLVTPADVDISIFYGFVIVLCAWTRSLAFLWGTTIVFAAAILPSLLLAPQPATGRPLSWVLWANRLFAMAALAHAVKPPDHTGHFSYLARSVTRAGPVGCPSIPRNTENRDVCFPSIRNNREPHES